MSASGVNHYLVSCLILILLTSLHSNSNAEDHTDLKTSRYAENQYIMYRYDRYIFFFFSENVTYSFFHETATKMLTQMDNFCGGENFQTTAFFGSELSNTVLPTICVFCSIGDFFALISSGYFHHSTAKNISAGEIDNQDLNNISAKLIEQSRAIGYFYLQPNGINITTQVIVITDYATASLQSNYILSILEDLKTKSVKFIALTTNVTNETAFAYFPQKIWSVFPDYINWTPEMNNPICGYDSQLYTTPSTPFAAEYRLSIYLFLSSEYVKQTELSGVVQLVHQLTLRRWLHPCRQFRNIKLRIVLPFDGSRLVHKLCTTNSLLNAPGSGIPHFPVPLCSVALFRSWFSNNSWQDNHQNAACANIYSNLLEDFIKENRELNFQISKFIIITNLPLPCPDYGNITQSILRNFTNFATGAPLTVIAIDKEHDKSVALSYAQLFPVTQQSNLYEVNNITELLENINRSINVCVDSWPSFDQRKMPNTQSVWYYYQIGTAIILALLLGFAILMIIKRNRKRRENLMQIRDRVQFITTTVEITKDQNDSSNEISAVMEDFEVSLNNIDIDYVTVIGKGAFSIVHKGYLHGKAPVVQLFPSIALQQFADCFVAVKILPHHSSESDKERFGDEIHLMKEIGYNVHLVSMLGFNCSIERPILLMELAKQDLLHWFMEANVPSETEIEPKLEKTLLSISWQVSDGMSYLSSKNFLHRDVAARNVLLNNEMKAMISDFGLCQKLEFADQVNVIPGGMLPLKWMALESLQHHQFSLKTDVWSFGILLFEIFSFGQEPYLKISRENLISFLCEGNRLDKPRFAKEQMYDLMRQCWDMDAAQRPTFIDIQSTLFGILEETAANNDYLQATEENQLAH